MQLMPLNKKIGKKSKEKLRENQQKKLTDYPKSTVRILPSKLVSKHFKEPLHDALNEFPWRAHVKLLPSNDQRFLVP